MELDKAKESDALRRMFFWDSVNKKRIFILAMDYTIKTKGTLYDLEPKTVYFLVCVEIQGSVFENASNIFRPHYGGET